jgi:hypothetical protein
MRGYYKSFGDEQVLFIVVGALFWLQRLRKGKWDGH